MTKVKRHKRKTRAVEKDYRIVRCKNCGHENRFPHDLDREGLDMICDECGLYLEEYE